MTVALRRAGPAVTVSYRETPDGQRQSAALQAFERQSNRKRSEIVAELPFEHDQYKRYLRGDTPMKWDLIPPFARAFRTTPGNLSSALGLTDSAASSEPADSYSIDDFRRELREAGLPDWLIEQGCDAIRDHPPLSRRATAKAYRDVWALKRDEFTDVRQPRAG